MVVTFVVTVVEKMMVVLHSGDDGENYGGGNSGGGGYAYFITEVKGDPTGRITGLFFAVPSTPSVGSKAKP